MRTSRIYLDTTVPSAYLDGRATDRQALTRSFWHERLPAFRGVISSLVLKEIEDTPDDDRRRLLRGLVADFEVLPLEIGALELAEEYVERGIFSDKYESDAIHVAVAVINDVGYLASWNFRHLVRVATRREVNLINAMRGYSPIEIVAPPEV